MDFNMKFGQKNDAFTSFLHSILEKISLKIRKFAFVRKILMDGNSAFGVEYERHGEILQLLRKRR